MTAFERLESLVGRLWAVPFHAYPRVAWQIARRSWMTASAPAAPKELHERDLVSAFGAHDRNQMLSDFNHRKKPIFFWSENAAKRASFVESRAPGLVDRMQACGEEVLAHRFDLLGSGKLELGTRIPWRRDFKSGYEWRKDHFTRLKLVDLDAGFDIKIPWELSRFHQAVILGQCYSLTGQSVYVTEFMAQLQDWWVESPCEFGPNWANAMEVGIRSVNLIWAYELMRASPQISNEFTFLFLRNLFEHGRYIVRHLENGWPGSNHFIANLCGLIWLGIYLGPAPEAQKWLQIGLRLLTRELRTQVYPDGAHYEVSSGYHILVTEMVLWTCAYCKLNDVRLSTVVYERLAGMLDVIHGMIRPDGEMPLFGDCDSGRWLALESDTDRLRTGQDARGLLVLGAVLLDREDWLSAAAIPELRVERQEAALWAFGLQADVAVVPSVQGVDQSVGFPDVGWYVMRAGQVCMFVNTSENGSGGWGIHAHNDTLSFELVEGRRAFMIDPGSYVYTGDYRARNAFRATASHNTVQVDTHEMNRIPERDMFRLNDDICVNVRQWGSDNTRLWLEAEYVSRAAGREMLYHRRKFEYFLQERYWLLTDHAGYCDGRMPNELSVYFHFAALPVQLDGLMARTMCTEGTNLAIFPLSKGNNVVETAELQQGWISCHYGVRERAPVLRYTLSNDETTAIRTVLLLHLTEDELALRRSELQRG